MKKKLQELSVLTHTIAPWGKVWVIAMLLFLNVFNSKGAEFTSFSWAASSNIAGATNVTYTFTYQIVTANPNAIIYALNFNGGWDCTSASATVTINGTSAAIASPNIGASGCRIQLSNSALATAGANIVVTLTGVTNGASAGSCSWYWIQSATSGGGAVDQVSSPSPIVLIATPSAPTVSAASSITSSSFSAHWSTVTGATKYYLDVATDNAFSGFVSGYNNLDVGNVTSYSVTGLTAGSTYYYRVRSYNAVGTSGNSSTITTTTSKISQTITFGSLSAVTYGNADIAPGATASSSLTVAYSSSNTAVATIVAGNIHIISQGTVTIYADQAGNGTYNAATQVSQSLTINKKGLSVTGATVTSKVYDGATTATITGASLSGVVGAEVVTLGAATSGTFASSAVGTGESVTTAMTISGAASGNYTLTQPTLTGNITTASLSITGVAASNKVYDGSTTATLTGGSLTGIIGADVVTLTDGTGAFADANVGTAKTVTASGYSISGAGAGNYTLSAQPSGLTADITAASLSITGVSASNKVYDGATTATLTGGSLTGIVNSDVVTLTAGTGTFADANVGTAKTVTASGYSLSGTGVTNYALSAQPSGLTADITARPLTITAHAGQSKKVGAVDPVFAYSITSGSLVGSESLSGALSRATGETAGNYAIEIGTLSAGSNFSITFASADFTVSPNTSVPTMSANKPKAYPNPVINLLSLDATEGKVTVYGLNGSVLIETSLDKTQSVDMSNLPVGTYILILKTKEAVYEYKVIKQ